MKHVSKSKALLSALLASTILSGCSLTEFVTGQPQASDSAQTNAEYSNLNQGDTAPVIKTTIEKEETRVVHDATEPSTETMVVEKRVIKRLPAEKPNSTMSYYGSVKQPYRPAVTHQGSNEQFIPPISQHSLSGAEHSVVVEEYIERVSTDLINSLANNLNDPVIGVTSFVDFNNNLTSVTPFGNRIAEHFISELQQSGFMVADYKVKDTITVNHNGDLVFSRNTNELNAVEGMTHVLAGTIMYQEKGLKIIARVVDFDNKWVVASASTFMPYFVLDTIVPSGAKHTVY